MGSETLCRRPLDRMTPFSAVAGGLFSGGWRVRWSLKQSGQSGEVIKVRQSFLSMTWWCPANPAMINRGGLSLLVQLALRAAGRIRGIAYNRRFVAGDAF